MTPIALRSSNRVRTHWRKLTSVAMLTLTGLATLTAVIPLIWILAYVIQAGLPALNADFFTQLPTPAGVPGGGIANSIVGSIITVSIGLVIAAPIGVLTALYVYRHVNTPLGIAIRFGTDVVAGVPSIIMGIFVFALIVLPQKHFSALAGGVALGFIMLPIITRTTEEMLRLVPTSMREGSLALGAPEWKTSWQVILPAAMTGVLTGLMLAISRAAGEAAPMLFTAFGNPFMSTAIDEPIATLPHTIFVYAISPYNDWHAKAWATALVLIVFVFTLNVLARSIVAWRVRRLQAPR
jgi:phosphate transport system permease protein